MEIVCFGISHRTAKVEARERFAIPEPRLAESVAELVRAAGLAEAVILSTCNRVECYGASDSAEAMARRLEDWFAGRGGAEPGAFYRKDLREAARHLFSVASGLDSMVVGETEILGQVKKAYQIAGEAGCCGPYLNRLFQKAFQVAKEVRTFTDITRGPTSVGAVAVELAGKIFGRLEGCRVMILGAGETSEMTARALLSRGVRSLFVANRSFDRAVELARQTGGEALRFDDWDRRFHQIDILIGSTAAPHPIVTREKLAPVMAKRRDRPLFVIDLAVPRDAEPSVNEIDGVYLYDIDSLEATVRQTLEVRGREVARCEGIIGRHVEEFVGWMDRRRAGAGGRGAMPGGEGVFAP